MGVSWEETCFSGGGAVKRISDNLFFSFSNVEYLGDEVGFSSKGVAESKICCS